MKSIYTEFNVHDPFAVYRDKYFTKEEKKEIEKRFRHYIEEEKTKSVRIGGKSIPFKDYTSTYTGMYTNEDNLFHTHDAYFCTYAFTRNTDFVPNLDDYKGFIIEHHKRICSIMICKRRWQKKRKLWPRGFMALDYAFGDPTYSAHYHGVLYVLKELAEDFCDIAKRIEMDRAFQGLERSVCHSFLLNKVTYLPEYAAMYAMKSLRYQDEWIFDKGYDIIHLPDVY